jgi:hypothetical protein
MAAPTREDATLMVQLATLSAELGLSEATSFVWSDEFSSDYQEFKRAHPVGSKGFEQVTKLAGWYETVATLVKNGLLSDELVHDWLAVEMSWRRLEGILAGMREESGEPRLYENFQALVTRVPAHA